MKAVQQFLSVQENDHILPQETWKESKYLIYNSMPKSAVPAT
jgi:hypothetical protein